MATNTIGSVSEAHSAAEAFPGQLVAPEAWGQHVSSGFVASGAEEGGGGICAGSVFFDDSNAVANGADICAWVFHAGESAGGVGRGMDQQSNNNASDFIFAIQAGALVAAPQWRCGYHGGFQLGGTVQGSALCDSARGDDNRGCIGDCGVSGGVVCMGFVTPLDPGGEVAPERAAGDEEGPGVMDEAGLAGAEAEMVARYSVIEDGQERLQALVSRRLRIVDVEEAERTEENLVRGCNSRVWIVGEVVNGRMRLRMTSESALVRGLAAVMVELCEGRSPQEILEWQPVWSVRLGLDRLVSGTRREGMERILERLRELARRGAGGGAGNEVV